ncbi:MAG: hypothetical protein QOH84_332 [Kribbellaceae bacterium]|nr:hypothetical protein [Kribbellaceae bacterium]
MLPPNLPSTPKRDGRNNDPIKLQRNRRRRNPHDVRDRIKRPDLMKVHLIRLHPMSSPLRPSQPSKGVERALPHSVRKPSPLDQPSNLSPSPRMPTGRRTPVPVPVAMPGLGVLMPVACIAVLMSGHVTNLLMPVACIAVLMSGRVTNLLMPVACIAVLVAGRVTGVLVPVPMAGFAQSAGHLLRSALRLRLFRGAGVSRREAVGEVLRVEFAGDSD